MPAGAFQRIVVRVAGRADWSDFGTDRAVFYLLGNMAILTWSDAAHGAAEKRAVLRWRASGRQLRAVIAAEVDAIERFFPGLPRLDPQEDAPPSAREPVQVLVLAATDEAAALVEAAVEAAAQADGMEGLVMEAHGPTAQRLTAADLGRVRVLVVCMSPELSASRESVGRVEALLGGRVPAVPVLLAGFDSQWGALQQLARQPSAGLRACSATRAHTEAAVRAQVEAEERARLAREGRSGKPTPKREREERASRETDERLKKQAIDAAEAVRSGLLPLVKQLLRAWRAQPPAASGLPGGGITTGAAAASPDSEVRQCPACARKGAAACGYFGARECRLRMGERLEQRSYAAQCRACGVEVSLFDVFPPEVYGSLHTPPGGLPVPVSDLIRAIEAEADVLIWPARHERGGGGPDAESRRALALAQVVLLVVTEEYAASPECAAEARAAVRTGKLVVPVLLPGLARDAAQAAAPPPQEAGRQRPEEVKAFWRGLAAHRRDTLRRRDTLDWALLGDHAPLVVPAAAGEPGADSRLGDDVACEAAARIASRLHRAVKVAVFSDLSRFGVRLSYFAAFIERCGGPAALAGLTTFEVMERFVKPRTAASLLSLCEQLMSDGGDEAGFVATARVFLSHAWKYLFLDVADAVERRFRVGGGAGAEDSDPVLWFDVFSVSQHKSGERDFAWWNSTFLNAVGSMGEVVMVMQPWSAPVPLTRVWCIFEAYAAEATRSRFSVAMTKEEASDLVAAICADPAALLATLRRVRCEASTATKAEDRERIFDTVRQSVGFAQLDAMVAARMMQAVCDELFAQAEAARATGDLAWAALLLQALAQLRGLQRNHPEAERLHRECLSAAGDAGLGPEFSIRASAGVAAACARQGKGDEAREAHRSVLHAAAALPRGDPVRLEAAGGLALECWAVAGQRAEADHLAEEWEAHSARERCGAALHSFGMLRLAQGRAADAERLLRAGADALRERSGEWSPLLPWHPDTLEALAGVAAALEAQGRTAEAEEGLRGVLALSERFLGAEHADTRAIRGRLAALVASGGRGAAGAGTGIALGTRRPVEGGSQLVPSVPDSEQAATTAGALISIEAITTPWGVLEALWRELPSLSALQELRLRKVEGLDRGTCLRLALMALGLPAASLRRVDLR
jgi:hypothetical protein